MRLLCRLLGHRWQSVYVGRSSTCLVCLRCRENGWRV